MCGIAGLLTPRAGTPLRETVTRMTDSLVHRGPDSAGVWVDEDAGAALGHRRLAIIDVSAAGHQPMCSRSGRFVLSFNGEIYNFEELRDELVALGHAFQGRSDTEVLLAAIEAWGIEAALQRATGMFALAAWDRHERELVLARDRIGEKPLYYGVVAGSLAFASELKALERLPGWTGAIDPHALTWLLSVGYIPSPHSIFRDIRKLEPASLLRVRPGRVDAQATRYWALPADGEAPTDDPAAIAELDARIRDAVRRCMISDVPLGAFISGGIDSSVVVAAMQAQSTRPVRTFTISFDSGEYDEALHAGRVARHLGTDHTELKIAPRDALEVIPKLPHVYDEPFADVSQIPTYLVSKLARMRVTVALSGDGGDELFGGYNRYTWGPDLWQKIGRWPKPARAVIGSALRGVPASGWDSLFAAANALLPARLRMQMPGDRVHKLAGALGAPSWPHFYGGLVRHWARAPVAGSHAQDASVSLCGEATDVSEQERVRWMTSCDLARYLPDDVLVKLDRASMAVSLETRVPLLDRGLVEFAWRLPSDKKIRNGKGKWILREVLARYMPRQLYERPKMGFAVPIDAWLRGPLRDWAEDLLSERSLAHSGLLDSAPIRTAWRSHLGGRQLQTQLWDVLMFQAWARRAA